ncbi:A/G-specific DNA-adenine glycosylase [Ulvibacter antarcticus]|uniref:Adenine DNA glycosylase n=1 Tax=Ulvibacter antarcticus TaxID=442714 RepID=A0A3L9ZGA2_9FLAO|nr:A/G-specific DNA-adenine glycosylase [Ulvibacter antarcticus]
MWYLQHKRDLPWRNTKDPYRIWLSEIMLQQTRVAQGLPYYERFLKAFPTIKELATTSEDKILKLWQGLGYYSRARNLYATANYIWNERNGKFPSNYKELLTLKGVGDYTASAIASICYDEKQAVVDGNVYRVLSRVFGISTPINSTAGIKEFKSLAQLLIDGRQPGTYNQAIMEFGARHCTPQNPDCGSCIFSDRCIALKKDMVGQLPVKIKKLKIKKRYFNYIVILSEEGKTVLKQRTKKGIWQQLYEFPLVETEAEVDEIELKEIQTFNEVSEGYNIESLVLYNEASVVHKLSHQHLYTRFWIATLSEENQKNGNRIENEIPIARVRDYAVPVLIENFISDFSVFKI